MNPLAEIQKLSHEVQKDKYESSEIKVWVLRILGILTDMQYSKIQDHNHIVANAPIPMGYDPFTWTIIDNQVHILVDLPRGDYNIPQEKIWKIATPEYINALVLHLNKKVQNDL